MSFAEFKIKLGPVGRNSKIEINGTEVQDLCKSMALYATPNDPTVLQLEMFSEGVLEGEGIVEVSRPDRTYIREWLLSLSRQKVNERALNKGGWGDEGTIVDHVVEVLLEILDENTARENSSHS